MDKKSSLIVAVLSLFSVLAGIGLALVPPPPPPPPVPQNIGIYDTTVNLLATNATDQSACRQCHQTTGTNVSSSGYNNTIGGVPTRHHDMLPEGIINPYTNAPFGCTDCHPSTPGIGNGILLDRSCQDCHNGTGFWADSIGGHVGNFSRPHHINTTYDDANIGNPAPNRLCKFCHGSFVDNYNDSHYIPSYNTSFMITPYSNFKVISGEPNPIPVYNSSGLLVQYKQWGGCESCHLANPNAINFSIVSQIDSHHEVMDILNISNITISGVNICKNCHTMCTDISPPPCGPCPACRPIQWNNITNINLLGYPAELRNSTIEQEDFSIGALEPGTTNVTINGTGCEKCHSVRTLHNIQFNYSQNGVQGLGHINNNTDCYGCHNSWVPADTWTPGALIPSVDSITPSVLNAGIATTLTITGLNFINPDGNYTSVVNIDGVTYASLSETATQIVVNIPGLNSGIYKLQLVKGGDTLSKLVTLTVVSNPTITSVTLNKGTFTITGTGFGSKPPNAGMYISVNHAGNQIISTSVSKWSETQIIAKNSAAVSGDVLTVLTANAGEAMQKIQ